MKLLSSQKLMFPLRQSVGLFLIVSTFSAMAQTPKVDLSKLVFENCAKDCQAKKALRALKSFPMPKDGSVLQNPLGSNVCQEQLKGRVELKRSNAVCVFSDGSSVGLPGLHLESEKFIRP